MFLNGEGIPDRDAARRAARRRLVPAVFNAHDEPIEFTLPRREYGAKWEVVLDTADPDAGRAGDRSRPASTLTVEARSLVVLDGGLS